MQDNPTFEGRVVLVTGAARRIGAAIARALHGAGATLALHHRGSAAEAETLAAGLNATRPDSAACFAADLGTAAACAQLVTQVTARYGRLDGLVNNASSFFPTPLGTVGEAEWDRLMASNLKAPFFLAQAAAPWLARTSGGAIVNIADIHAERPLKGYPVYCAAKAGLVMLTRALARELAPGVRVNAVAPGAILWPEPTPDAATQATILARIPLACTGRPEDIAGAVLYLLGAAPYVTGQVLAVDGGRTLGW
jgi:pteridine reductase